MKWGCTGAKRVSDGAKTLGIEAIIALGRRADFSLIFVFAGRPRFGSVRLRFGDGTVRAVPVFGSGGSSAKRDFRCFSTV